jgi:hypothetical protein
LKEIYEDKVVNKLTRGFIAKDLVQQQSNQERAKAGYGSHFTRSKLTVPKEDHRKVLTLLYNSLQKEAGLRLGARKSLTVQSEVRITDEDCGILWRTIS